jgi:hypothetical protein
MTGTNCDLFTHKQSRSYLNHLVYFIISTIILRVFRVCEQLLAKFRRQAHNINDLYRRHVLIATLQVTIQVVTTYTHTTFHTTGSKSTPTHI